MKKYCCNAICGAPTTSEVKGLREVNQLSMFLTTSKCTFKMCMLEAKLVCDTGFYALFCHECVFISQQR